MLKKYVIGGVVTLGLLIFGFVALIRSCLSQFDERCVISVPLVAEANGKAVVFSLVKYDRTTSYSRNGGFVRKSVSTSYYVQANDAVTGEKLSSQKISSRQKIRSYPVEVLGLSGNRAWVFAGELMAFDPFTLEKKADAAAIETRNPSLKGKLTTERRYYEYDHQYGIILTASDGNKYALNTSTLVAEPYEETEETDPVKAREKELENELKKLRMLYDTNYARYRRALNLYDARQISPAAFQDSSRRYMYERDLNARQEDSVRKLQQNVQEESDALRDQQQAAESLKNNRSFSEMKTNTDSLNGKWYGLMTADELDNLPARFGYRKTYGDAARNMLYTASLAPEDPAKAYSPWKTGENKEKVSGQAYLQGGFLLSVATGKPVHLANSFLVVSKDQIGNEGKILLARVGVTGKQTWSVNTGLKDFSYWVILPHRIYVFGTDNKELSSGEINVMEIIDLETGTRIIHDFFRDRNRKDQPAS